MSKIKEYETQFPKQDLKIMDIIVISKMGQQTGDYENILVTNRSRWKKDTVAISSNYLITIEVFTLGTFKAIHRFHYLEEFENAINL